jgi:hypothetical protein
MATHTDDNFQSLVGEMQTMVDSATPSRATLVTIAEYIIEDIRADTLRGLDVYSAPFTAYTQAYAKEKKSGTVDLYSDYNEPHMLDLLSYRVSVGYPESWIEFGIFGNFRAAVRAAAQDTGARIPVRIGLGRKVTSGARKGQRRNTLKSGKRTIIIPRRNWLGLNGRREGQIDNILRNSLGGPPRSDLFSSPLAGVPVFRGADST